MTSSVIENPALTPTGFDALAALRTTLDRQRIAMCVFDRDDGIVSWNETYLAIFPEEADILAPGLPYRETLRRFYEVNLPSAELAAIEQHLEAGLERHRTQRDPFIYQRKDGRWIKSDSQRLENGYLLKTWVDFTEDGLAAQDWPDLKDAFANIDIAFALFGADGRFVSANKMYTQMFPYCVDLNLSGTPYQEHLLRHAEHTIDPSEHWRESIPLARALNASGALRGGIILRRRGGGWLQLEERPTKSGGMISFWSDVSERVQAQSQVETLQARLSDAIESLTEGVALYDQDERLLLCNQRYREINHAIADVIRPGMAWIDLLRAGVERGMFPEAAADPQTWIAERLTQRKNSGESFDIPLADGSWIRCTDRRTRDGGTISVRSDITDLKRREVELSRQANMLSAVSYAATRLIGNADFASTITELLAKIGTALTACRVLVFQCYDRPRIGAVWACRYEWRLPEVSSILDDSEYREVAMVDADPIVRDWNERLLRGEIIEYRFSQLPDSLRLTMKHDRHRVLTFVSVPIMIGGVCWGSLDVDDCRSERHWSAVDIEVLKTAAALLAGIVERSRVDAELRASEARFRAQAEMLEAISYAATRLIGKQSWQLAVNDLLARLGHAARVSRVAVLQVQTLPSGELAQSVRFDWAAPGVVTLSDDPHYQDENLADADPMLSDWVERRKRGAIVQAKASELTAYLRAEFERQNTLSFLSVPIMVEGAWWGHICFDDCQAERDWNGAEVDVLRTAASLLAGIIERSRVDDELRNSEQRFRTIAESIPVAINAVNGHGQVLYASPLAAALFRTPQDAASLARLTAAQFFADHQQRHYFLHQFRNTGTVENTELSLKRLDGTALPAVVTSKRIIYDGEPACVSILIDLSERKAAEAEIARQRDALYQAEKMSALGSLLAGVAHELNNPLAIVVGQALMMEQFAPDSETAKRALKIRTAAERCARIVKTFLAMARQRPAERGKVDLNAVIESALDLTTYGLKSNDIQVQLDLAPKLPPLWGDQDQLGRLLLNLIVNAQQALQEIDGARRLTIATRFVFADECIRLEVADNGPGIAPELRPRIFDPFFTTKPTGMGTGLGLSICHSIVTAHGGAIRVEDSPVGAHFVITFPLGEGSQQAALAEESVQPAVRSGHRILIVDDEPEIVALLTEILTKQGYTTQTAASGRQALEKLARDSVDLILCDLRMPDLDGPGLYRILLETQPQMVKRLIYITGDTLGGARALQFDPAIPVIEKPFNVDEVLRMVSALLDANHSEG